MKKLVIQIIFVYFLGGMYVFPGMFANAGNCAFQPGPCGDPSPSLSNNSESFANSLEALIIEGGMYFFEANSNFNIYLKTYESEDFNQLSSIIPKTISSMKMAFELYKQLNMECSYYSYNHNFINQLKRFNYDEYQVEFSLIQPIFNRVKRFLSKGDVRGAFKEIEHLLNEILTGLESLQDVQGIPSKSQVWRINQKIVYTMLLGQYMAEIYTNVKQGKFYYE